MPVTTPTTPPPSTADLVGDILTDAQELVSQQLELFKVEVQDDFKRSMRATTLIGAGLGFLLATVFCLGLTLAFLLHDGLGWSLSASMALATLVIFLVGAGLVGGGVWLFRSFNPLPDETVDSLQENVEWLRQKS